MAGILLLSIIIGTRDEREDRKFSRPFPSIFFSIVIGKTTARINVPNARKFPLYSVSRSSRAVDWVTGWPNLDRGGREGKETK